MTERELEVQAPQTEGSRKPTGFRLPFSLGFAFKFLFLAAINGMALFAVPRMVAEEAWMFLAFTVISTALIDWLYLSRRASTLPFKYLLPGTILLLAFQVWPVLNTVYIAFTNYGEGNLLTFDDALERIVADSKFPQDDDPRIATAVLGTVDGELVANLSLFLDDADGALGPPGGVYVGDADGLDEVDPEAVVRDGDRVVSVGDLSALNLGQVTGVQDELVALEVPFEDSIIRLTQGITVSSVVSPTLAYASDTGVLTDALTGVTYEKVEGNFTATDPTAEIQRITPGWRAVIGFDNFSKVLTDTSIRTPFLRVFVWTFVFAVLSVVFTFVVGLFLAITLNHEEMRGQRFYRSLLIVPYALPSFLSALIFQGMMNQEFGVLNEFLNLNINWLRDPNVAKMSVLLLNTWLGFPYMFLISTGALQAIPSGLKEAAAIDGATSRQTFRRVTFPLLMVALAPLLVASFAFNFNNFNTIFLLTGGGPPIQGATTPVGHTDILISYTFRLAFETGPGADFGLASSVAIFIFIIVATLSGFMYKRTRVFEELT